MEHKNTEEIVDHLFRHEYGKMVSILTRIFGFDHLEMVEDVVQDTFIKALKSWREKIPENPQGWLMRAAKNRAIDILRRGKVGAKKITELPKGTGIAVVNELFLEHEVADSQLRMIFACCHPLLNKSDQIALNLQLVSGFGQKEIGKALLLHPETVKKRLQRAKKKLRDNHTELDIPTGQELATRTETVLQVLYLLFNEGYYSSSPDEPIRKDLCVEAMRLTKIVCHHELTNVPQANVLLALMCYHAARIESRVGANNHLILLKDQDRSLWNQELIQIGHYYFYRGNDVETLSKYHLEAAIAGHHCNAKSYEETNWKSLKTFYTSLYLRTQSPIVLLNKAVVLMENNELLEARALVKSIDEESIKGSKHLYHSVLAEIYRKLDDEPMFLHHNAQAIALTNNPAEKELLEQRKL